MQTSNRRGCAFSCRAHSAKRFAIETIIGATAITSSATVKSPVIGEPTSDAFTSGPAPGARGSVCRERGRLRFQNQAHAHRIAQTIALLT